jgi:hypothetical protein
MFYLHRNIAGKRETLKSNFEEESAMQAQGHFILMRTLFQGSTAAEVHSRGEDN